MMLTLFLTGIIFFLAGLVQGVTGFGSALIAIPLLCFITDIKSAIPLSVLNSLIITLYLSLQLKTNFDAGKLLPLCIATLPGILVGVTFLKHIDSGIVALLLGVILISYSCYNLFVRPQGRNLHRYWAYPAGFFSGAIGSAFSAGGPPVILYTALTGWNKDCIKATLTGFFLFNSVMVTFAHAATGLTTLDVLLSFLFSCPFVLLGTLLGSSCYRFVSGESYIKLIYIFLILMGIMMITLKT
jgi:uncharacterized protein